MFLLWVEKTLLLFKLYELLIGSAEKYHKSENKLLQTYNEQKMMHCCRLNHTTVYKVVNISSALNIYSSKNASET